MHCGRACREWSYLSVEIGRVLIRLNVEGIVPCGSAGLLTYVYRSAVPHGAIPTMGVLPLLPHPWRSGAQDDVKERQRGAHREAVGAFPAIRGPRLLRPRRHPPRVEPVAESGQG